MSIGIRLYDLGIFEPDGCNPGYNAAVAVSGTHILARLIDGDSLIVQVRCEVEKKDITLDTALDRHTQISNL